MRHVGKNWRPHAGRSAATRLPHCVCIVLCNTGHANSSPVVKESRRQSVCWDACTRKLFPQSDTMQMHTRVHCMHTYSHLCVHPFQTFNTHVPYLCRKCTSSNCNFGHLNLKSGKVVTICCIDNTNTKCHGTFSVLCCPQKPK